MVHLLSTTGHSNFSSEQVEHDCLLLASCHNPHDKATSRGAISQWSFTHFPSFKAIKTFANFQLGGSAAPRTILGPSRLGCRRKTRLDSAPRRMFLTGYNSPPIREVKCFDFPLLGNKESWLIAFTNVFAIWRKDFLFPGGEVSRKWTWSFSPFRRLTYYCL